MGMDEVIAHTSSLATQFGADVHAIAVVSDAVMTRDRIRADPTEEMDQALSEIDQRLTEAGVAFTMERREGDPCETIVEYADERGVDLIVMGETAGSRLNSLFYGNTTQCVEQQSSVPVLVVVTGGDTIPPRSEEPTVTFHCRSCESTLHITEETADALLDNGCVLCGSDVTDDMLRMQEMDKE